MLRVEHASGSPMCGGIARRCFQQACVLGVVGLTLAKLVAPSD